MSNIKAGGNYIACPSIIGNTAGSAGPSVPSDYVAEDGTTFYVAENGTDNYVTE